MTAQPLHLQASQVGIERATQGSPSVWWQHGESQWSHRPHNHTPSSTAAKPQLHLNSLASSTSSLPSSDCRLYPHCQRSLSFYRVINRQTYTPRCAWIHSAATQREGCHTQNCLMPRHQNTLPSQSYKYITIAKICKMIWVDVYRFYCGAQKKGVISFHFCPWHPADNPSPFPDYVR